MRVSTSSEYSKISKSSVKFALMDVRIYVQESLKFSGPEGLYDYDVILWEPEHILATYEFSKVHHDSLIDKPRKKFLDDQKRRAKDFESFFPPEAY